MVHVLCSRFLNLLDARCGLPSSKNVCKCAIIFIKLAATMIIKPEARVRNRLHEPGLHVYAYFERAKWGGFGQATNAFGAGRG
jgi:hypothetical protein